MLSTIREKLGGCPSYLNSIVPSGVKKTGNAAINYFHVTCPRGTKRRFVCTVVVPNCASAAAAAALFYGCFKATTMLGHAVLPNHSHKYEDLDNAIHLFAGAFTSVVIGVCGAGVYTFCKHYYSHWETTEEDTARRDVEANQAAQRKRD